MKDAVPAPGGYPFREELACAISHGIGASLGVAGVVVLVALAATRGTVSHVVGCSIFGASLVVMYLASTLYHAIPSRGAKGILQAIDHTAIYLVIAGTYTPFLLVSMKGAWGWALLVIVWGMAAAGITLRAAFGRRAKFLRLALYLAMGWLGIVAIRPLTESLGLAGMSLVVGGGLLYTAGVPFYAWRRLPYHHAIWHLFVLGGSALHFLAILWYVVPR
jgi:hemolysin III